MAITAQRFQFLDKETNVGVSDMHGVSSSAIFNSPNNVVNTIDPVLQQFITNTKQGPSILVGSTPINVDTPQPTTRNTKGLLNSVGDISSLSASDLNKAVTSMFGGNQKALNAFKLLTPNCQANAMGRGAGKPYSPQVDCNGRKSNAKSRKCSSSNFGNSLNQLTGGNYNPNVNDLNNILSSLLGLSNFGYGAGLCGVFSAVAGALLPGGLASLNVSSIANNLASRASGGLLSSLGSGGDIKGFMDVASSSAGLHPLTEMPGAIGMCLDNFSVPDGITSNGLGDLGLKMSESMMSLDPKFGLSSIDAISLPSSGLTAGMMNLSLPNTDAVASIGGMCMGDVPSFNPKLDSTFAAGLMGNSFTPDAIGLNTIPQSASDFKAAAYSCMDSNPFGLGGYVDNSIANVSDLVTSKLTNLNSGLDISKIGIDSSMSSMSGIIGSNMNTAASFSDSIKSTTAAFGPTDPTNPFASSFGSSPNAFATNNDINNITTSCTPDYPDVSTSNLKADLTAYPRASLVNKPEEFTARPSVTPLQSAPSTPVTEVANEEFTAKTSMAPVAAAQTASFTPQSAGIERISSASNNYSNAVSAYDTAVHIQSKIPFGTPEYWQADKYTEQKRLAQADAKAYLDSVKNGTAPT